MTEQTDPAIIQHAIPTNPSKFPKGMIVLAVLFGLGFVGSLWGFSVSNMPFGPFMLGVAFTFVHHLFMAVTEGASLLGLLMRKQWARPLILGLFVFRAGYSILETIVSFVYKTESIEILRSALPKAYPFEISSLLIIKVIGTAIGLTIGTIGFIYVYRQRAFFTK